MPVFPAIGNPDFLAVATDEFLTETIRKGRPGRRMPAWGEKEGGLRPAEIANIVALSAHAERRRQEPAPAHPTRRWVKADAAVGRQLYATNCAGCHGDKGEGIEGPAACTTRVCWPPPPTTYLVEHDRPRPARHRHAGFRQSFTVHPALSPADIEAIVAFIRTWEEP